MNDTLRGNNSNPPPAMKPSLSVRNGFSLVEIIAVAAILLILLAIAVPEFQEARTVSDYVQVKSDIHSLVVAQETYYQDFGIYPTEHESNRGAPEGRFQQGLNWLTSPVPYIGELPLDPFRVAASGGHELSFESGGIESGDLFGCLTCLETWEISSIGPDLIQSVRQDSPHYSGPGNPPILSYSPTNGSTSAGEIIQFGGDPYWIGVSAESARIGLVASEVGLVVDGVHYLHRLPPPLK